MTRVADLASRNLTMSYMRETQSRMMDTQLQIATGKVAQRYSGMARDAARVVSLEGDQTRVQQQVANNRIVDQRLEKMETQVAAAFDIATRLRTLLVNASNGGNAKDLALSENAGRMLDELSGLLNAKDNGRYLFAGSRTDTAPADFSALPSDAAFAGRDAASFYYRGDDARPTARLADDLEIRYGVTAAETGFDRLVQALQTVRAGSYDTPDRARPALDGALRLVGEATQEIPEVRSRIGTLRNTIERANDGHSEFLLYADKTVGDLQNVDVAEAITRLSADQSVLEASYAAMARVSKLSLVDYLR